MSRGNVSVASIKVLKFKFTSQLKLDDRESFDFQVQRVQHRVLSTREFCRAQEALLPGERDIGQQQSSATRYTLASFGSVNLRRMRNQVRLYGQPSSSSSVLLS